MRKTFLLVFIVAALVSLTVCSAERPSENFEGPPSITITANGQPVEYYVALNMWNGSAYDRQDSLPFIMGEESDMEVPYIKLGGTIEIVFEDNPPEAVEIADKLVNEKGLNRYADKVTETARLEVKEGGVSYDFEAQPASFLSSSTNDYEDGNTYRGFYLRCVWNNGNDCEYAFVIRTDAAAEA